MSPVSLSVSRIVNGSYPYFSAFPDASSLRARYGLVGISGTPVLLTTATAMSIPPFFSGKAGCGLRLPHQTSFRMSRAGSLPTARSAGEASVSQTAESVVLFANVIRQFNAYRTSPALRDV